MTYVDEKICGVLNCYIKYVHLNSISLSPVINQGNISLPTHSTSYQKLLLLLFLISLVFFVLVLGNVMYFQICHLFEYIDYISVNNLS